MCVCTRVRARPRFNLWPKFSCCMDCKEEEEKEEEQQLGLQCAPSLLSRNSQKGVCGVVAAASAPGFALREDGHFGRMNFILCFGHSFPEMNSVTCVEDTESCFVSWYFFPGRCCLIFRVSLSLPPNIPAESSWVLGPREQRSNMPGICPSAANNVCPSSHGLKIKGMWLETFVCMCSARWKPLPKNTEGLCRRKAHVSHTNLAIVKPCWANGSFWPIHQMCNVHHRLWSSL